MHTATDAARLLVEESLGSRIREMRAAAERARGAYTKGPMFEAAQRLARAYDRVAATFQQELEAYRKGI